MTTRLVKNVKNGGRHVVPANGLEQRLDRIVTQRTAPAAGEGARSRHATKSLRTRANEIDRLYAALARVTPDSNPRTARLLASGTRKVAQKVIEEAGEVALAAVKHNSRGIVRESADLLYQLAVLWHRAGLGPAEVWAEMRRRADTLGIAEKLPKALPGG